MRCLSSVGLFLLVGVCVQAGPLADTVARIEEAERLESAGQYRELLERHRALVSDVEVVEKWAKSDAGGLWRWLVDGGEATLSPIGVEKLAVKQWLLADPDTAFTEVRARGVQKKLLLAAAVGELVCDLMVEEGRLVSLVKRVEWESALGAQLRGVDVEACLKRVERLPDCLFVRELRKKLQSL